MLTRKRRRQGRRTSYLGWGTRRNDLRRSRKSQIESVVKRGLLRGRKGAEGAIGSVSRMDDTSDVNPPEVRKDGGSNLTLEEVPVSTPGFVGRSQDRISFLRLINHSLTYTKAQSSRGPRPERSPFPFIQSSSSSGGPVVPTVCLQSVFRTTYGGRG